MSFSIFMSNIPMMFTFGVALAGLLYLLTEEKLIQNEERSFDEIFKAKLRPFDRDDAR
jgi:hypothetical protein